MVFTTFRGPALATCLLLLGACAKPKEQPERAPPAPREEPASLPRKLASVERPKVEVPEQLDWLLFGGGSDPLSNQVSLAQDLEAMRNTLGGTGLLLFASGPEAFVAIEDAASARGQADVARELARMFGPPFADRTRYERVRFSVDGPSTAYHVLSAFEQALTRGRGPLFVYAASHGEQGERASDNLLSLWGGWPLKVSDLAQVLEVAGPAARPTRFVITACYGGGFAELAFVGADPRLGPRSPEHCGLFAAPWDDEASGCDPNPDRRAQESYAIHFLHALAGRDRHDMPRLAEIDLDGDGRVGLLEAHTYARVHSRSFDAPTTTSERYLREVAQAPDTQVIAPSASPEDFAVVRILGAQLELEDERAAREKLEELERILDDASAVVAAAEQRADDAYYALRIALLERWPLLEHPWDPRTARLLAKERRAISHMLNASDLADAHRQAARELDEALHDHDAVRVERARVLRLTRAYETLRLESALRKKGGDQYTHYQALRACERWVPPSRTE